LPPLARGHQGFDLRQLRLADPGHVQEVTRGAEPAVLLAVGHDLLSGGGTDAGKGVEGGGIGGVQVDRPARHAARRRRRRCGYPFAGLRHVQLLTVGQLGRQVDPAEFRSG